MLNIRTHSSTIDAISGVPRFFQNLEANSKYWAPERDKLRAHSTKFSRRGDLAPGICTPERYILNMNNVGKSVAAVRE
jgi:hypothetical protein